jgi:hypothetical protein
MSFGRWGFEDLHGFVYDGLPRSAMMALETFSQTGFSASTNPKKHAGYLSIHTIGFFVLENISRNKIR